MLALLMLLLVRNRDLLVAPTDIVLSSPIRQFWLPNVANPFFRSPQIPSLPLEHHSSELRVRVSLLSSLVFQRLMMFEGVFSMEIPVARFASLESGV
ncbi:hypothetical protein B0H13DRAFT_269440 [Mycena leptocephala]|nr:hypothetical protein B0H13DRAFT_269440 [Mycena leptocephala]